MDNTYNRLLPEYDDYYRISPVTDPQKSNRKEKLDQQFYPKGRRKYRWNVPAITD